MHKTDLPYNAWPSLHVTQSLMIVLLLRYWKIVEGWKRSYSGCLDFALYIGNDYKAALLFRPGFRNNNRHDLLVLYVHTSNE